jgi:hypothetical protein
LNCLKEDSLRTPSPRKESLTQESTNSPRAALRLRKNSSCQTEDVESVVDLKELGKGVCSSSSDGKERNMDIFREKQVRSNSEDFGAAVLYEQSLVESGNCGAAKTSIQGDESSKSFQVGFSYDATLTEGPLKDLCASSNIVELSKTQIMYQEFKFTPEGKLELVTREGRNSYHGIPSPMASISSSFDLVEF